MMPNYVLSRTSPPSHIYERNINLGYGIKMDTSDAPQNQPKKEKKMEDAKTILDVADHGNATPGTPVDGSEINAFGSATALDEAEKPTETPEVAVN